MNYKPDIKREDLSEDIVRKKVKPSTDQLGDYLALDVASKKKNIQPLQEQKRKSLPIYGVSHQILDTMQTKQVIVITGGTGCGKSTQVPQMILRHHTNTEFDEPRKVNILCTQPRRLAAKSLAKRVAQELECQLGTLVGYQVGMDSYMSSKKTQIQFVTTGIFLQKLVHDREKVLMDYTHIIMDEVHERDIDIDFCLIIIKNLLKHFPETKLILMSATICSNKFANYFSTSSIQLVDDLNYIDQVDQKFKVTNAQDDNLMEIPIKFEGEEDQDEEWGQAWIDMDRALNLTQQQREIEEELAAKRDEGYHFLLENDTPAPIISVPMSQVFPIDTYYLETFNNFFNEIDSTATETYQPFRFQTSLYFQDSPKIQQDSVKALLNILTFIESSKIQDIANSQSCKGAVLIFLPGYQEIMDIRQEIQKNFGEDKFIMIVLHSTVTIPKDFDDFRQKKRRLILSTNVAESSITVPDCRFVIDFCMTKEIIYNPKNLTEKLALQYCSKASADQRKGRTGRLFPGICIRLIPQSLFKTRMLQYSVCEMLRCPLEIIILRLKKLYHMALENQNKTEKAEILLPQTVDLKQIFNDPRKTLKTAIDPPSTKQIDNATHNLQLLGALTYPNLQDQTIQITRLGQMMSDMPIDIYLTRFIMYCNILGCAYEGVTIAAILSQRKNFFLHHFTRSQYLFLNSLYLYDQGNEDDLLTPLRVYQEWEAKFFNQLKPTISQNELRKELKRFTNMPINELEKLYCKLRSVDPKNMREILNVKYELFMRLDQQFRNESLDLNNPENLLKIKSAFCAGFKQNTIKLMRDERFDKRIKFLKDQGFDYTRTIMIESDNLRFDGISIENKEKIKEKIAMLAEQFCDFHQIDRLKSRLDGQLKDIKAQYDEKTQGKWRQEIPEPIFRSDSSLLNTIKASSKYTKNWVKSVVIMNNTIIIEFKEVDLQRLGFVIKRWMHECELLKRNSKQQYLNPINWRNFTTCDIVDLVSLVFTTQSEVFYGCSCRMLHQHKELNCDQDSINFIALDTNKVLVAYEIQEKDSNKRNSTRQLSSIDQSKYVMWSQILAMLFGVNVKLFHNNMKSHFLKAKIDGRDYDFDYFITEEDLHAINSIRSQVKMQILQQDYQDSGIWKKIRDLDRVRQRILLNSEERWKILFDVEMKDQIAQYQESTINKQRRKRLSRIEFEEQKGESLDYMKPIQILRTDDDSEVPKQFDNEGIQFYVQIQQLYQTWKQNIINTIKKQNFFLRMGNTTQICCLQCNDYMTVGRATSLQSISNDSDLNRKLNKDSIEWAQRMVMILNVSQFGDYFNISMRAEQIQEFLSDQRIQSIFEQLKLPFEPIKYVFVTCISGKHIIGFYPKIKQQSREILQLGDIEKFYIIDQKLRLVYTNMEEEKFVFRKLPLEVIKKKESRAIQQRKIQSLRYTCKCCYNETGYDESSYFEGGEQEYSQHIKLASHKKAFEELQYTII